MKISAYTIIHYGIDYLPFAIGQIYNAVDKVHIVYTPKPSHGHTSNLTCPETKADILTSLHHFNSFSGDKIFFHQIEHIKHEGPQRDYAIDVCKRDNPDIIMIVDYDEIWPKETLEKALEFIQKNPAKNYLVNMTHFWRSFNWVCRDNGWPVRFINPNESGTEYIPTSVGDIYHFGYAIRDSLLKYKISIHGHKAEFRKDWLEEKWNNWKPGVTDVHPTNEKDFWTPEPFDKRKLPPLMRNHHFWNREIIK